LNFLFPCAFRPHLVELILPLVLKLKVDEGGSVGRWVSLMSSLFVAVLDRV